MGRAGRPFPTHTPLGRLLQERGMQVYELSQAAGVYHRTLTEYLAGRKRMIPKHRALIADALRIPPELLDAPAAPRPSTSTRIAVTA